MTLIAIEEHWIMPDLTSALQAAPPERRDESLAFNEMGDNRQRLEDLGAGRIAAEESTPLTAAARLGGAGRGIVHSALLASGGRESAL